MSDRLSDFHELLTGKRNRPSPQTEPAVEGRILDVYETTATFVVPDYDANISFGPAPFGRTDTPPQTGDRCLVVFLGVGIDRQWITAWTSPE